MEVSTYLTTGHTYCQVMCDNLEGGSLVREQGPEELVVSGPDQRSTTRMPHLHELLCTSMEEAKSKDSTEDVLSLHQEDASEYSMCCRMCWSEV